MFYIYILQSIKTGRYYIGHTNNIGERLKRHNSGRSRFTKKEMPWKLIYREVYDTKSGACKREVEIKKYKGGIKFKKLLNLGEVA